MTTIISIFGSTIRKDIFVHSGTELRIEGTVKYANNQPVNLTDGDVSFVMAYDTTATAESFQFDAVITSGEDGQFSLIKEATKENGFGNRNLMYQIYVTPVDHIPFVAVEGNLYVTPSLIKGQEDDEQFQP